MRNKLVIDKNTGYWLYRYWHGVLTDTLWLGLSKGEAIFYLYQLKDSLKILGGAR